MFGGFGGQNHRGLFSVIGLRGFFSSVLIEYARADFRSVTRSRDCTQVTNLSAGGEFLTLSKIRIVLIAQEQTPLMFSAMCGYTSIVKMLTERFQFTGEEVRNMFFVGVIMTCAAKMGEYSI